MNLVAALGLRYPLIQAPMAGVSDARLAAAVCAAGGLGSLPCALLDQTAIADQVAAVRQQSAGPFNLNFFCHSPAGNNDAVQQRWREALSPFYEAWGIEPTAPPPGPTRRSFSSEEAALVAALKPAVVSFHFGLPAPTLLDEVKASGALVLSSANTLEEARWLEANGADAVIAQGIEAGGHRGMFLQGKLEDQPPTLELLGQIIGAVSLPVIAAGGIGDRDSVRAALNAGAAAVQVGTAFMLCPECGTSELHRRALRQAPERGTVVTNLYSGRPARSVVTELTEQLGPISPWAPPFPTAAQALGPLRAAAEAAGRFDFTPVWSGARPNTCREIPAAALIGELFG